MTSIRALRKPLKRPCALMSRDSSGKCMMCCFLEPVELELASLREKAVAAGLDTASFNECLESGKYADRVDADIRAGVLAGVTGTPAAFINGRPVLGAQPFESYAEIIDDELGLD